jgi:hypothetical protein
MLGMVVHSVISVLRRLRIRATPGLHSETFFKKKKPKKEKQGKGRKGKGKICSQLASILMAELCLSILSCQLICAWLERGD